MNDKERLYYLLKEYCKGNYKTERFTELFSIQYNQYTNYENLNEIEREAFDDLSVVTDRFSPFEEDFKNCPKAFFTDKQVRKKAEEVINILSNSGYIV